MGETSIRWAFALILLMVVGSVATPLAVGQEQANETEPPGIANGSLESLPPLLDTHTELLVEEGFSANGTANVTIIRQNVLVNVERTANRTVTANASEYRQSQESVADAAVASVSRGESFWGNDSVETLRRVENGETTFNVSERRPNFRLSEAARLGPYLRSANYTVVDAVNRSADGDVADAPGDHVGGDWRYTLNATELVNETRLEIRLPEGATDPRNFNATVVVDEDGRIHEFDASVDYTIQGSERTHTITFNLVALGVDTVTRPPWVDDALAQSANETERGGGGTQTGGDDSTEGSIRHPTSKTTTPSLR